MDALLVHAPELQLQSNMYSSDCSHLASGGGKIVVASCSSVASTEPRDSEITVNTKRPNGGTSASARMVDLNIESNIKITGLAMAIVPAIRSGRKSSTGE